MVCAGIREDLVGDAGFQILLDALLERLVAEKLQAEAEAFASEGWKWIEVATDLPYGYSHGLRRLVGDPAPMTDEESAAHATLLAEYRGLEEEYSGQDEYPEEIDARLGQLEMAMEALRCPPGDADVTKLSGGEIRRAAICALLLSTALGIVWALILDLAIWSHFPDFWAMIGICAVSGAGIYTFYRERVLNRRARRPEEMGR